uniref:Uncharacterized protein n=1 Tax=Ditylenchus dipsaci TaxID=166011 RepID=A0A915DTR0_9BILA
MVGSWNGRQLGSSAVGRRQLDHRQLGVGSWNGRQLGSSAVGRRQLGSSAVGRRQLESSAVDPRSGKAGERMDQQERERAHN